MEDGGGGERERAQERLVLRQQLVYPIILMPPFITKFTCLI